MSMEKHAMSTSPNAATPTPHNATQFDAIVVGAGLAGLYVLHRLRGLGLRVRVYEAGDGIGGTWFWNRYPGARCDVESLEYSYSFSEDLQQEWKWPERYGTQPEILRYINHVADRLELRRDIQLNTRVVSAIYDAATRRWTLTTDRGVVLTAAYCIMATGNLSTPRVPDFKGLQRFRGNWYHTGLWPKQGVDFSGRRVAVIGTGSTGVQMIPHIAKQATHLHVFQRTANFILPARNVPMDPEKERRHKSEYAERRRAAFDTPFGISGYPSPTQSALEVTPAERQHAYEAKWAEGGSISFLYAYTDLLLSKEANDTAAEFVRDKVRGIVHDPAVAELLAPKDHPIGTKRLCLDTDYYETYNRDNVTLVDARRTPIEEITATGLRTGEKEYEVDRIVFATGFDAMTGALAEIDVRTRSGTTLKEQWAHGPRTYLGLMVAGFPNLFLITGPGSPGVKSQMILSIEQHTDWIVECLEYMRARGFDAIEAEPAAQESWVDHVRSIADATLYPLANSWYMGANIPGKPRIFMPYVGGVHRYKKKCDAVAQNGYEGFRLTRSQAAASRREAPAADALA
jgi:cyclohexanone monooxygenase